jgi:uncharacterized membrane protein
MREEGQIMRGRLFIVLSLALVYPSMTLGVDPAVSAPVPARAETAVTPAAVPPAQVVNEKPAFVEKPKPADKPRVAAENARPPEVTPSPAIEPPAPAAVPAPAAADNNPATPGETSAGYSFGCVTLSFAMLIIGFAAGFLGRHFLSRHKLGGMTVRIGTWRGIP